MIHKPPPLNRALKGSGFSNHGSTLGVGCGKLKYGDFIVESLRLFAVLYLVYVVGIGGKMSRGNLMSVDDQFGAQAYRIYFTVLCSFHV